VILDHNAHEEYHAPKAKRIDKHERGSIALDHYVYVRVLDKKRLFDIFSSRFLVSIVYNSSLVCHFFQSTTGKEKKKNNALAEPNDPKQA